MNKNNLYKIFKIIKIILWLLPFLLFIWVLDKHFVLSGKLEIKYKVEENSKLVKNFASKESDKLIGTKNKQGDKDYFQLITKSPVYFDVKVPRPFQKATVTLKYQNPDSQPVIKLGIEQASKAFYYIDMAFAYPVLDNLPDYWDKIQEDNSILWEKNKLYMNEKQAKQNVFDQKKKELDQWQQNELNILNTTYKNNQNTDEYELKKENLQEEYQQKLDEITKENIVENRPPPEFSDIKEFLSNLPEKNKIVQLNYDLSNYFEMPNYQKSYKTIEINKSLRGKHEIYTYIGKGEDLNFDFTIQDINWHTGEDIFKISVFNNKGEMVKKESLSDDGNTTANGMVSLERKLQILMENIQYGIYRLVIDTSDDIFIKNIVTFQHLIMFKEHIFLTDNENYKSILDNKLLTPTTIYTNGSSVTADTPHSSGFQTLKIGKTEVELDEVKVAKNVNNLQGIITIITPFNDVGLYGNGFFAFAENQLFDPNFSTVAQLDNITNIEGYDYIIANYYYYSQANQDSDWLEASSTVNTQDLYFHKDNDYTANFIFSLPGLFENKRILKIKEVDILFEKEPINFKNFFPKFKNWLNRTIKSLNK